MIAFFRKIRQNLLAKNQVSRYLIYAIGEILLVVIGILIALQANNWNEHRKNLDTIEETKKVLVEELKNNISATYRYISRGYEEGKKLDAYLNQNGSATTNEKNYSIYGDFSLFDTFTFVLDRENIDKWIEFEKELPETYAATINDTKRLKQLMVERKGWENLSTDLSITRLKDFADQLPWFYNTDSNSVLLRKKFLESDPIFRNKAIHFLNFQLNENVWYTTLVRAKSIQLLWKLTHEPNDLTSSKVRAFFEEMHLKPFEPIDCNEFPYRSNQNLGFRNSFLGYNASNQEVHLRIVDHEGHGERISTLPPQKIEQISVPNNYYLEIGNPCQSVHAPVEHGYLIIE